MADVVSHNSRTVRHWIFKLSGGTGGVDHLTRHVQPRFKVKRSQGHVTYPHQQRCNSAMDSHINFKPGGNYHRGLVGVSSSGIFF